MKAEVLQENLSLGLNLVSRTVGAKTNLPILGNILISIEEGKIKLTSTNLETGINFWLPAKKIKEGRFTIPAKDLTEFVGTLPAGKIVLEQKKEKLILTSGNFKASFNGMSAADFPKVPSLKVKKDKPKIEKKFKLKLKDFIKGIESVYFAAAQDETRPILTGVRISCQASKLELVATDGYRLSVKRLNLKEKLEIPEFIVPARSLVEVARISQQEEDKEEKQTVNIALTKENNQVIFSLANLEIVARLIEGEFPDFAKIIPDQGEGKVVIDTQEFNQAIKAASIFARQSTNIIKLKIKSSKLKIMANAPEVGENEIELGVKMKGKEGQIAFNFRFLQDFLNCFDQKSFSLEFSGPLKPGLFKIEKDAGFLHVIMPVRLQEEE